MSIQFMGIEYLSPFPTRKKKILFSVQKTGRRHRNLQKCKKKMINCFSCFLGVDTKVIGLCHYNTESFQTQRISQILFMRTDCLESDELSD